MKRRAVTFRSLAALGMLLGCALAAAPVRAQMHPPAMQRGEPSRSDAPPAPYRAAWLDVDWTHPLLRVEVVEGLEAGTGPAEDWPAYDGREGDHALVQLVEPVLERPGGWRYARGTAGVDRPTTPTGRDGIALGAAFPWLATGPGLEAASPLAEAAPTGLETIWQGRKGDLAGLEDQRINELAVLSINDPRSATTRFLLLAHDLPGEGRFRDLIAWLDPWVPPSGWVALHAGGPHALAAFGGEPLLPLEYERFERRLGVALRLREAEPGDPVDYARLGRTRVRASGAQRGFLPRNVIRGRLLPAPMDPVAWVGRRMGRLDDPGWLEVDLLEARPINLIRIGLPASAGWSEHFNPGRLVLKVSDSVAGLQTTLGEFEQPGGAVLEHRFNSTRPVRFIRVELPEPTQMGIDARPRLTAVQAIGPWDGQTRVEFGRGDPDAATLIID